MNVVMYWERGSHLNTAGEITTNVLS